MIVLPLPPAGSGPRGVIRPGQVMVDGGALRKSEFRSAPSSFFGRSNARPDQHARQRIGLRGIFWSIIAAL